MSLERIKGKIVWLCNSCDAELETETSDFTEARTQLLAEGWSTFPIRHKLPGGEWDGEWGHHCFACQRGKVHR